MWGNRNIENSIASRNAYIANANSVSYIPIDIGRCLSLGQTYLGGSAARTGRWPSLRKAHPRYLVAEDRVQYEQRPEAYCACASFRTFSGVVWAVGSSARSGRSPLCGDSIAVGEDKKAVCRRKGRLWCAVSRPIDHPITFRQPQKPASSDREEKTNGGWRIRGKSTCGHLGTARHSATSEAEVQVAVTWY